MSFHNRARNWNPSFKIPRSATAYTVELLINGHFGDKEFCPLQGGFCYWECLRWWVQVIIIKYYS